MTKQTNIFNKLKANLKVLLPVCFALMISVGSAFAEPTYQISEADIVGQISQTPSGNSQVFRQQPDNSAGGSTAFSREARQFKRALNNSLTGQGHGLGTYAKSLIGDGLNAGLSALDEGLTNIFSSVESSLPNGWIKDLLVTYNPVYQVTKFASKAVVKIAKFATGIVFGVSNRECNKERMDAIYKSGCYACDVVTALIGSFMNACTYLYDVAKEAGSKILWVGVMLWVAFYVLQQLSSLKNLEPSAMVNELLIMAFKVLGAYLVINAGIDFFISYAIVPFMNFGAQFGIAMLASASAGSGLDIFGKIQLDSAYAFQDGPIPAYFLNQLQQYIAAVDYTVSTHLEIGHMLTCHATHAGAYDWEIARIPNIWIWLSGAFIWFMGFMMTLSVTYYLVDISFKLGFAIIALPITVGLWPFNITKGKLGTCFSIILNSAGILIFLAMTVAAGLALVSNALDAGSQEAMNASIDSVLTKEMDGTTKMMTAIEDGDNEYIDEQLAFWSFGWIVLLFAYLFAMKLIGSTKSDYVNQFFSSKLAKSDPMHMGLTQMTDMAKQQAVRPIKFAGKIAKHQAGKGVDFIAGKMFGGKKDEDKGLLDKMGDTKNKVDNLSKGKFDDEGQNKKKPSTMESAKAMTGLDADKDKKAREAQSKGSGSGGSGGAGQGMQQAGQAMQQAGQGMQQTADAIDQSLGAADQSVKAGNQAVQGVARAGSAATLGLAAPITETAAATSTVASTAASAGLNAGRLAAKAMKTMGKVMEKTGKAMEKAGKGMNKMQKVANKLQKAGQTVNKFADKVEKNIDKTNKALKNAAEGSDAEQQQEQRNGDMIGGAANKTFGTGNKKK